MHWQSIWGGSADTASWSVSGGCGSSQSKLQKEQMQAATSFQAARQQINDMSVSLESARLEIDEPEQALAEATNRIKALEQPTSLVIRDDAVLEFCRWTKGGSSYYRNKEQWVHESTRTALL